MTGTAICGVVILPASHRIGGTYGFVSGSPTVFPSVPHLPTSPRISCNGIYCAAKVGVIITEDPEPPLVPDPDP